MSYIDGFVAPIFPGRREEYRKLAADMAQVFLEYGALQIVETFGNDVPEGKITDFHRAIAREEGEGIVFSWILWPSKEARRTGWDKAMADPRMKPFTDAPFDMKRMIFGEFDVIYDSKDPA